MDDKKNAKPEEQTTPDETLEESAEAALDAAEEEVGEKNTDTEKEETTEDTENEEEPKYATPNATDPGEGAGTAQTLISLESLIKRYIGDIDKLRDQLKTQKDMHNDTFNNDPEYATATQKVKEVARVKAAAKQKIQKQPSVVALNERINELKEEIKDMHETLSSYLEQYKSMSATNQIVDDNGAAHEIVTVTKLVKKGKYRP